MSVFIKPLWCLRKKVRRNVGEDGSNMKKKCSPAFLFIIFIIVAMGCSKSEPFPNIQLPIHPKAIDPKLLIDKPVKGAKALVYKIQTPFPANEITSFYENEIAKLGFHRAPVKQIATFKWENFNNRTGEWEETDTVPARYTATRVNSDRSIRIWLYMVYKYNYNDKNWKENLTVSCNIADYFE